MYDGKKDIYACTQVEKLQQVVDPEGSQSLDATSVLVLESSMWDEGFHYQIFLIWECNCLGTNLMNP